MRLSCLAAWLISQLQILSSGGTPNSSPPRQPAVPTHSSAACWPASREGLHVSVWGHGVTYDNTTLTTTTGHHSHALPLLWCVVCGARQQPYHAMPRHGSPMPNPVRPPLLLSRRQSYEEYPCRAPRPPPFTPPPPPNLPWHEISTGQVPSIQNAARADNCQLTPHSRSSRRHAHRRNGSIAPAPPPPPPVEVLAALLLQASLGISPPTAPRPQHCACTGRARTRPPPPAPAGSSQAGKACCSSTRR